MDYMHYRFYKPTKRLMYMGVWTPDILSKLSHKMLFYVYVFLCQVALVTFLVLQSVDLYLVFGNMKKMTFNFCSSTVVICIIVKIILLLRKREKLRRLHWNLWKDSTKCNDAEDVALLDAAHKKLVRFQKLMYLGPYTVLPVWATASYFSYKWGPRLLPFAAYFPVDDFNDDVKYVPILIYEIFIGFYASLTVIESDLTMLAAVLQIGAHYKILSRNLIQTIEGFEKGESGPGENKLEEEVDVHLRREIILRKLKAVVKRHSELLQYCDDVEYIFNRCMVIQILGGSFVILMNGVETTRHMTKLSFSLYYQMMYLIFLVIDIYSICYHFTTLTTECTNLGEAAYDSSWYKTDAKVKRMLCLIITRTQKPPKFTYGKLFIIDINAFMQLIKNIYSWLMLLRQLETK